MFGAPVRKDILARMVNWQLAKRRAGTHKVKGRSEISTARRPSMFRQKGTGARAPHSVKVSQFRSGGGVPSVRRRADHAHKLPKKVAENGHAVGAVVKQADGELIILDQRRC